MKEIIPTCVLRKEAWGGYSSLCPELDVASRGDSIEEATKNLKEAVEGHIHTAVQENMLDDLLEKLGISKEDSLSSEPILVNSFSTALAMELPV